MPPTAATSPPTAAVSRLLLLADEPRSTLAGARARADARVRRYRLARLRLHDAARAARHAPARAGRD